MSHYSLWCSRIYSRYPSISLRTSLLSKYSKNTSAALLPVLNRFSSAESSSPSALLSAWTPATRWIQLAIWVLVFSLLSPVFRLFLQEGIIYTDATFGFQLLAQLLELFLDPSFTLFRSEASSSGSKCRWAKERTEKCQIRGKMTKRKSTKKPTFDFFVLFHSSALKTKLLRAAVIASWKP